MKIGEHLYFAPGTKFTSVDTTGTALTRQLDERIRGFYLHPVLLLVEGGHAFAAGVLIVVAIDALARLDTGSEKVGERFRNWCTANLHSCKEQISKRFYESFRNGLVHEARIKDGCEFTFEIKDTFQEIGDILSCNPTHLLAEVESALDSFIKTLEKDSAKLGEVRERILKDFDYEFKN